MFADIDPKTKATAQVAVAVGIYYALVSGDRVRQQKRSLFGTMSPEMVRSRDAYVKFLLGFVAFDGLTKLDVSPLLSLGLVGLGMFASESVAKTPVVPPDLFLPEKAVTGYGWAH
jgi:hypothetical protein